MEAEATSPTDQRRAELKVKDQEALDVIKKDVCEWVTAVVGSPVTLNTFWEILGTGVVLCQLAKNIQIRAGTSKEIPSEEVSFSSKATQGSFFARDNAANFIKWCRKLGVPDTVMFESNGLVMHTDDRRVVLCLLEVGRHASKIGMAAPQLVKFEEEIEATEASEALTEEGDDGGVETRVTPNRTTAVASPVKAQLPPRSPPVTKASQKGSASTGFEKKVLDILSQCTCKDKITVCSSKNAKFVVLISNRRYTLFARVLSDRIMVRVGGGWDSLDHFLFKHDPCRGAYIQLSEKSTSKVNGKGVASPRLSGPVVETGRCGPVEEADGGEPEKKTHSSNTSAQATPSPATVNPIAALTCVLITAFVLYVYFGGLRSSVVIGAVIVALMAIAYFYNTPAQGQPAKKEN